MSALDVAYSAAQRAWHGPLRALQRRRRARALAVHMMRLRIVRERVAFTRRELSGRPELGIYTHAASGTPFCIRHRTHDVDVFDELLIHGEYAPPAEVAAALRSVGRPLRIADIGGHIGLFGVWALANWDVGHIVSFEPNVDQIPVLREQAALAKGTEWDVVGAAAWTEETELEFSPLHMAGRVGPHALTNERVRVPAQDVFPALAGVDVVKLDIEGSEWPILADERFAALRPRVLVMEYHDIDCPRAHDAPGAARDAVERAGLRVVHCSTGAARGLVWALGHDIGAPT